jgi:NADH-quinone oxidoreductase subunit M
MQGATLQMFSHGVNILGLWIVAYTIERQYGTRKISELGGLAQKAPVLATLLVVIGLASIALPLTNAFIGEFMMFNGVFSSKITEYNVVDTALALVCIILAAIYTLNMIRKIFYGEPKTATAQATEAPFTVNISLTVIVVTILLVGVYPRPLLQLTSDAVDAILSHMYLIKP